MIKPVLMGLALLIAVSGYVIFDAYEWHQKKKRWRAYNKKMADAEKKGQL